MRHVSTLDGGLEGHQEARAVASAPEVRGAAVVVLGPFGTRQRAIDTLSRPRSSQAQPRGFVYEAGPCGAWRSRSLTKKHLRCGGVAPALVPPKTGARVHPSAVTPYSSPG